MTEAEEAAFHALLQKRPAERDDLSARDRRALKASCGKATAQTIFRWHTDKYTVFEDETDPIERKRGVRFRRVGVKPGGRLRDAEIAAHETRLGITLPAPWRDVYRFFNGGTASHLYWGDLENPRATDIPAVPGTSTGYFALEDVAPLSRHLAIERPELDVSVLDDRLIALAFKHSEAIVLDYRNGDAPSVGKIYVSQYENDPLAVFEHKDSFWWPSMALFFRGLYLQDRST